jgi:hypothetical protein
MSAEAARLLLAICGLGTVIVLLVWVWFTRRENNS